MVCLDHKTEPGYLDPAGLGRTEAVDLLSLDGEHRPIPFSGVKSVHFVREFDQPFVPARKYFLSRPRQEGLWVQLRFVDGDQMEGLVPNNLLGLLENGIQITPPESNGNNLRLFIPRTALTDFVVLGVVGAAQRARHAAGLASTTQGDLFGPRSG